MEEFCRKLGIPPSIQVPLINRMEGDRIWLSRDSRGISCLIPALIGAGTLAFALIMIIHEKESIYAAVGVALMIVALVSCGLLEKMANPETVMIDVHEGAFYRLGRWRWRPGPVRRYLTKDLYLFMQSKALYGWTGGETPMGMVVSAVAPHPDEWASGKGKLLFEQFLLASDEEPDDDAMASLDPGVAALQRAFPWKGLVVRSAFIIEDPAKQGDNIFQKDFNSTD